MMATPNNASYVQEYTIKHITVPCKNDFATVRKAIEASLPRMDNSYVSLLEAGDFQGAYGKLEALPTLNSFTWPPRDFGMALETKGVHGRKAVQYDIGNPFIAITMAQHHIPVALYAPVRVMLTELEGNTQFPCGFSFDLPTSTFGNLSQGNKDVLATATFLEGELIKVLTASGGYSSNL